jgi:nucleoside-diphosphate-sugar epimerase
MAVRQRVLLTGATGHVGGRLFSHLLARESVDVRAVVRSPHRLAHFAKNAEILGGDLVDQPTRRDALQGVDCVVHLATRGFSSAKPPTEFELAKEEEVTLHLVADALRAGVARLLYLSSIHVYGQALSGDVDDLTPTAPNTPYGHSRQRIEQGILELAQTTKTQVIIVRLTNSFGVPAIPRAETWDLLLHDLCRQVIQSQSITLRSDGRVSRDTMALRDVVEVLSQIMTTPADLGGVCLLASGHTMQLIDIAESVQRCAKDVLGVDAHISAPSSNTVQPPSFVLHPTRLLSAGITIPQNRNDEICDLLRYAQREFGTTTS